MKLLRRLGVGLRVAVSLVVGVIGLGVALAVVGVAVWAGARWVVHEYERPGYSESERYAEKAERETESVRRYCKRAVNEAQEIGCLSHVDAQEVP